MSFQTSLPWLRLQDALNDAQTQEILVCTGAGISHASGIPTFRGSDIEAVWKKSPMELGTASYFESDPVGHWKWFLHRIDRYFDAKPNPAHEALATLEAQQIERGGTMTVVTQNVDLLHERAGTKALIHIHGEMGHVRCSQYGCKNGAPFGKIPRSEVNFDAFRGSSKKEDLPRCPLCGALIRIHALLFDEYYTSHTDYQIRDAMAAAARASLMIFIGTSFSVGITASFLEVSRTHDLPVFSIDPEPHSFKLPHRRFFHVQAKAEEALPLLAQWRASAHEV